MPVGVETRPCRAARARLIPAAAAALLAATLAACAVPPQKTAQPPQPAGNTATLAAQSDPAAETDAQAATEAAGAKNAGAGEPLDAVDPTGPELAALPAALPAKPAIDHDPKALIGLDRGGLSELLGQPRRVRREQPAEIWQYVGSDCVFDVFLYEESGAYRVIHAEARDDEKPLKTEPRACLNKLLQDKAEKPLS